MRHDEQRAAAPVRTHRDGELHQHVHRIHLCGRRTEAEQRFKERRAVGQTRARFIQHFDLIALEHGDVDELARL